MRILWTQLTISIKKIYDMKTTQKEYETFIKSSQSILNLLGLTDFDVYYEMKNIGDEAEVNYDCTAMNAVITCCTTHGKFFDPVKAGKHEALHLLLATLKVEATSRSTTDYSLDQAVHGIIHRLEKVL